MDMVMDMPSTLSTKRMKRERILTNKVAPQPPFAFGSRRFEVAVVVDATIHLHKGS